MESRLYVRLTCINANAIKTKVACYELELKEQPNVYNCLL